MANITIIRSKERFSDVLHHAINDHEPHLFDYMGEYTPNYIESQLDYTIINSNGYPECSIYFFKSWDSLIQSLLELFDNLDISYMGDDQFFDYYPSVLEETIYGLYVLQLSKSDADPTPVYNKLKEFFTKFKTEIGPLIEDNFSDDVNYESYLKLESLIDFENHSIKDIDYLEVSEYLN